MVDAGLAVAPLTPSARAVPRARKGSCRGVAVVPGKALAWGLVDLLGKEPAEGRRLLVRL